MMKENRSFFVINNYSLIEITFDFNSKASYPLPENPGEEPISENSIDTIIEIEDFMDFWFTKNWFEIKLPKLTISNALADNYKESEILQFQIDIVSPPPQV